MTTISCPGASTTTPASAAPAWAVVGAPVALIRTDPRKEHPQVRLTRLARVTRLALVTEEGLKFHPDTLEAVRGHGQAVTRIASTKDPAVAGMLEHAAHIEEARSVRAAALRRRPSRGRLTPAR